MWHFIYLFIYYRIMSNNKVYWMFGKTFLRTFNYIFYNARNACQLPSINKILNKINISNNRILLQKYFPYNINQLLTGYMFIYIFIFLSLFYFSNSFSNKWDRNFLHTHTKFSLCGYIFWKYKHFHHFNRKTEIECL